jgi:DNA-binding GntR family transcriptional regulator
MRSRAILEVTHFPALRMSQGKPSSRDVYNELRELILSFNLYPGSRVTEQELASLFGVSRTPIRSALQRLEAEGYLTIQPKQGCYIRNLDIQQLAQYYQVRIALEMLSLELACTYMADADLKTLADSWDPDKQLERNDNPEDMEARDESFHIALANGGGNMALTSYLADINNQIRIIRRLDFTNSDRIDKTYEEHHTICMHLLARNLARAQALMRQHITRSENFAKNLTLTQLAHSRHALRRRSKSSSTADEGNPILADKIASIKSTG